MSRLQKAKKKVTKNMRLQKSGFLITFFHVFLHQKCDKVARPRMCFNILFSKNFFFLFNFG